MTGYTEQDVELVAEAVAKAWCYSSVAEVEAVADGEAESLRETVDAVLAALAAAGRLPPEDTRTEWGVIQLGVPGLLRDRLIASFGSRQAADEWIANNAAPPARYDIRRRQRWVGPWVPVPEPERGGEPSPMGFCSTPSLHAGRHQRTAQCRGWAVPEAPKETPDRYMMATIALHATGDLSRDVPSLAIVYGETADHYVGEWATGMGFVNVRFPKATTRDLTADERDRYRGKALDVAGVVRPIQFHDGPAEAPKETEHG